MVTLTSGNLKSSSRDEEYNDLVEQLYQQEVKINDALETIQNDMEAFYKKRNIVLEKYNNYVNYNNRYYEDAKNNANRIKSIHTKQKIIDELSISEANYKIKLNDWYNTITTLNNNEKELTDLHQLLKIKITIAIIESYQTKELPSTTEAKSANTELIKIIEKIKAITK